MQITQVHSELALFVSKNVAEEKNESLGGKLLLCYLIELATSLHDNMLPIGRINPRS